MAITRKKKEALVAQYIEEMQQTNALFLTNYQGLTVNEMTSLRHKLREADGDYTIVKNTLAKIALEKVGLSGIDSLFEGPVGIGFCHGDPPPVAKVLVDFAKETKVLEIKGGLMDNAVLDESAVKNLADLPPMDVLRAQLLGVISAPATQLASVVASGVRQVINVVNAYAESGEGETAAA